MYKLKRKSYGPVMEQRCTDGMEYLVFPALEKTGIVTHLFSSRIGGASTGIYSTVNYSYDLGDVKEHVDENYRRTVRILGGGRSMDDFVRSAQTHTTNVRIVTEKDRGKGVTRPRDYTDVDGLVTDVPGLILVIFWADCVPLFFVDPVHRAIGASHAGWRGTIGQIGKVTLETMHRQYGTNPGDCICAIGPSICGDCYEVGADVAGRFEEEIPRDVRSDFHILRKKENGKYLLDLWQANRWILEEAGVPARNISVTDICTRCNRDFLFSHRITGFKRGVNAGFLSLNSSLNEP